MAAIEASAIYLPARLARKRPEASAQPRTAAAWDEDSFTMAAEAGTRCLRRHGGDGPSAVDLLISLRFRGSGEAGDRALLEALGLDPETVVLALPAGIDGAADALELALADVDSGARGLVLVLASSTPGCDDESDGAAAVLIGGSGVASAGRRSANLSRFWPGAAVVPARFDRGEVLEPGLRKAFDAALTGAGWGVESVARWSYSGPGRHPGSLLGLAGEPVGAGSPAAGAGPADLLIGLAALAAGEPGRALAIAAGERVAVTLWEVTGCNAQESAPSYLPPLDYGTHVLESRRRQALQARQQIDPMDYLRESGAILRLEGVRCARCGRISTAYRSTAGRRTVGGACEACGGEVERVRLARQGTVRAITRSQMEADPVAYVVCDLDGGGRLLTELAGGSSEEVEIGDRVDLVLRRGTAVAGSVLYLWKAVRCG